jgi:hypothetical protein
MSAREVAEADCVICSGNAELREKHFSTEDIRMPLSGVCLACQLRFFATLSPPPQPTEH